MKRLLAFAAVAIVWGDGTVSARWLDPATVAGDAKWLVHIDFDAMRSVESRPARPRGTP